MTTEIKNASIETQESAAPVVFKKIKTLVCSVNAAHAEFLRKTSVVEILDLHGTLLRVEDEPHTETRCFCGGQVKASTKYSPKEYLKKVGVTPYHIIHLEDFLTPSGKEVSKFFIPTTFTRGFIVTETKSEDRVEAVYDLETDEYLTPSEEDVKIGLIAAKVAIAPQS